MGKRPVKTPTMEKAEQQMPEALDKDVDRLAAEIPRDQRSAWTRRTTRSPTWKRRIAAEATQAGKDALESLHKDLLAEQGPVDPGCRGQEGRTRLSARGAQVQDQGIPGQVAVPGGPRPAAAIASAIERPGAGSPVPGLCVRQARLAALFAGNGRGAELAHTVFPSPEKFLGVRADDLSSGCLAWMDRAMCISLVQPVEKVASLPAQAGARAGP
jgi:hypothetical protein